MTTDDAALSSPDVIIIGGGQSALATAYFLRRTKRPFVKPGKQQPALQVFLCLSRRI